jgi:SpoVK/Ycf46/Vps4 family AAA+-type ATPase
LRGKPLALEIEAERLAAELAARSTGLSGAAIALVCNRAALAAVRRKIDAMARGEEHSIRTGDFETALAELTRVKE